VPVDPVRVSGQNLAKKRRTKPQRIFLAEALAAGKAVLFKPTMEQSAALLKIRVHEIYRARQARKPKPQPLTLAEHLAQSSPTERAEAARALGVDKVWDSMVAPLVGAAAE
jgi:hypothetical protein